MDRAIFTHPKMIIVGFWESQVCCFSSPTMGRLDQVICVFIAKHSIGQWLKYVITYEFQSNLVFEIREILSAERLNFNVRLSTDVVFMRLKGNLSKVNANSFGVTNRIHLFNRNKGHVVCKSKLETFGSIK